jgi:hypothetical protein
MKFMTETAGKFAGLDVPSPGYHYRLTIHISRLDITNTGTGVVEADWEIVPRSPAGEIIRCQTRFSMSGPVATDQSIARFERALLDRLAGEIDVSSLR